MLSSVVSWFNEISFDERDKAKTEKVSKYVYRDELDLEKSKSTSKLKKRNNGETKPLMLGTIRDCEKKDDVNVIERKSNNIGRHRQAHEEEKKGINYKVKILMTKEEAARLLSKCKDGGVLEFKEVAHELVRIPTNRVTVVSGSHFNDNSLQSIPEEL